VPKVDDDVLGEALLDLVRAAVAVGLERQRAEPLLRWLIDSGPAAFPQAFAPVEPPTPDGHRAFAAHLGVGVWNALPLPRLDYRRDPLPHPERNRPCPCGSGRKLKRCCGRFGFAAGAVPEAAVLPFVGELLPEEELPRFGASGALGPNRLADVATHLLETPRRTARLLEQALAEPERLDARYAAAVDVLLEAYERLGWDRKRHELAETLVARARPELQTSVWLRRVVAAGDLGDFAAAHEALRRARDCDPSDERLGPMEVKILEVEGRYDEAAARARFVLAGHRRRPLADDDSQAIDYLRRAAAGDFDPRDHFDAGFAARLERLERLLAAAAERPAPGHAVEAVPPLEEGGPEEGTLAAPPRLQRLEAAWQRVWPLDKPFGTQPYPFDADDLWTEEAADRWLSFLEEKPAALDSLSILDDLLQAVLQLLGDAENDAALANAALALWQAVTGRGETILVASLAGRSTRLRWGFVDNRPALRLLVSRVSLLEEEDPPASAALIEHLLALNPDDNHGMRGRLVDHRLREGDDGGALAAAALFPDDLLPEVLWGPVLAHYRRGDHGRALTALAEAHRRLPRIGAALTSRAARRPSADPDGYPFGYISGGAAEAEAYAQSMHDVWANVPGLLDWLRKTRRGLGKGGR
jgi:tetratricopeptide (TPR) repeat protein